MVSICDSRNCFQSNEHAYRLNKTIVVILICQRQCQFLHQKHQLDLDHQQHLRHPTELNCQKGCLWFLYPQQTCVYSKGGVYFRNLKFGEGLKVEENMTFVPGPKHCFGKIEVRKLSNTLCLSRSYMCDTFTSTGNITCRFDIAVTAKPERYTCRQRKAKIPATVLHSIHPVEFLEVCCRHWR